MPALSGSQKAYKQARVAIARSGSTRVGYYSPNTVVLIGGLTRTTSVMPDSIRISKNLNDEIDTCRFSLKPGSSAPTAGDSVVIGAGISTNREFAGQIVNVEHRRAKTGASTFTMFYDVSCVDYGRQFDRRLVTQVWYSTSISAIVNEIIDTYTSGFTRNRVEQGLDVLDYFPATNAKPSELLRRLAQLAGGGFYIDPDKVVHFFGSSGELYQSNPLSLTDTRMGLRGFTHLNNASQIRTRVIVDGMDTRVTAALDEGATVIPVEDASMFNSAGGYAVVDQEVVTYTGKVDGGGGSLVGPGVAPPSYPSVALTDGAGIESGAHYWVYTWVTGSGETLPSPAYTVTPGPAVPPSLSPSVALAAGTGLSVGAYQYAVTFVVGAGETTPGPVGSVTTNAGISAPGTSPSASQSGAFAHTGGRYVTGDSVWVRVSYVDATGGETGGTDSNTIVAAAYDGTYPQALVVSSMPIPSDPAVVAKRIYLNVNGSFVAYRDRETSVSTMLWTSADTATGSFPVGGSPARQRVSLSGIPTGAYAVTARKLYRTTAGGSTLLLLATIADNTTTTYADSTADGSLGAAVPATNTTQTNQALVVNIATGPTGVTSRKLYRSQIGGTTYKLVTTIADNTTTQYADSAADASLGADVPTNDTSGLTQEDGQVNAGDTTVLVAGPGSFSTSGGWALVQGMFISYTGISGSTLTGIPTSGVGSLAATVSYGSTIIEAPRLTGIPASGAGSLTHAIASGANIALRVIRDDTNAQAAVAVIEGGDGIYEYPIVDARLNEDGAIARGDAELDSFSRELVQAAWVTTDLNAQPGRQQTIALSTTDPISTTVTITRVELTYPTQNQHPVRSCEGGTLKTPRVLDAFVTEQR